MRYKDQKGGASALLVTIIICLILIVCSVSFGAWAYFKMQDYKNNSDQKVESAVTVAVQQAETKKDNEFIERDKNPLKKYEGPPAYGAVNVSYPKTWSAYIVETTQASNPINAYFHPDFVPNTQDQKNAFALRLEVVQQAYAQILKSFESQIKAGKVKATPYKSEKVPGVTGMKLDGQIETNKNGSMVILPIRDKTIKIYTQSVDFKKDFEEIILKNLTFTP